MDYKKECISKAEQNIINKQIMNNQREYILSSHQDIHAGALRKGAL